MRKYDTKLVAILGAIMVHLIAGIIFMVVRIGSLKKNEYSKEYEIAIQEVNKFENNKVITKTPSASDEQILQNNQQILDIARNVASKPDLKINAEDYIDRVKEELIKSGKLGKDNYIDEQKRIKEKANESEIEIENKSAGNKKIENNEDSRKMAAAYGGPTRIYFNLVNRNQIYLPLPIYKCEGSGKIVLTIDVDQKGYVAGLKLNPTESTTSDPCIIESATEAAKRSRFNPDINAPRIQTGTLTYHFVAQ